MTRDSEPGDDSDREAVQAARVLRAFFRDGRLVTIPARAKKRLVVLHEVRDRCFREDREYLEQEVNQRLALVHPDVAALRRYLVEVGLMTREAGVYRRVPGDAPGSWDGASATR